MVISKLISPGADIFMKFSFPTVNTAARTQFRIQYVFEI